MVEVREELFFEIGISWQMVAAVFRMASNIYNKEILVEISF